jgi:hypothetical protein
VNGSPVHWLAVVGNHGTRDGARCRWTLRGEAGTGNEGTDHQEALKSPQPGVREIHVATMLRAVEMRASVIVIMSAAKDLF